MANPEHVEILRRGAVLWNQWRGEHPLVLPDLMEGDLSRADLRAAKLDGADLYRADLSGADLFRANLSEANLSKANLKEAALIEAHFIGANLSHAVAENVLLAETVFTNTSLTDVVGLDTCKFRGPCVLDHRTLQMSGNLPLEFLRGCGLPDFIIDNIAVLQGNPLQFYSCFISHATTDKEFADRLYADLQSKGIRCWYSPEDLKTGDRFRDVINQAIRVHDKLLVILSKESVYSDWVEIEVERAFSEERRRKQHTQDRPTVLFPYSTR